MKITIVVGPPCAGKSTHCAERAKAGDVVVDFDKLATAFGASDTHEAPAEIREVALVARDSAIATILGGIKADAWIIHTAPTAAQVKTYTEAGATFDLVDPGEAACHDRALADGRPDSTADAITTWYESPPDIPTATPDPPAPSKAGFFMPEERRPMKFKTAPVSIKSVDGEAGTFEAVVSVFGNTDSYGDVVMPGAFTKTLAEWAEKGDPIPVYWSHRMDDPDYNIGHVLEASETDEGLLIKAQLDLGGGKADQVHRLLKGRRVTQFSFAYDTVADKKNGNVNELHELKLYEVGPTPIGANQLTNLIGAKGGLAYFDTAAAEALPTKADGTLTADAEAEVRAAVEEISAVITRLQELLPEPDAAPAPDPAKDDQAPATGTDPANADEPKAANADEPTSTPSAKSLATAQLKILSLNS